MFTIYFSDEAPEGLNLKTYPNEQTIKESKCCFHENVFCFSFNSIFIYFIIILFKFVIHFSKNDAICKFHYFRRYIFMCYIQ